MVIFLLAKRSIWQPTLRVLSTAPNMAVWVLKWRPLSTTRALWKPGGVTIPAAVAITAGRILNPPYPYRGDSLWKTTIDHRMMVLFLPIWKPLYVLRHSLQPISRPVTKLTAIMAVNGLSESRGASSVTQI